MTTPIPASPFEFGVAPSVAPNEAAAPGTALSGAAAEFPRSRNTDIDCIGEIFAGAKRLDDLDAQFLFELDPGNQKYRGMRKPRLDVGAFMADIEEAPLFLRKAG